MHSEAAFVFLWGFIKFLIGYLFLLLIKCRHA